MVFKYVIPKKKKEKIMYYQLTDMRGISLATEEMSQVEATRRNSMLKRKGEQAFWIKEEKPNSLKKEILKQLAIEIGELKKMVFELEVRLNKVFAKREKLDERIGLLEEKIRAVERLNSDDL